MAETTVGGGLVEVFRVSEPDAGCAPVQDAAFKSRPVSGGPPDHPPAEHPDYNLGVRGYVGVTEDRHLVDYDVETDSGAPQLPRLLPGGIPQPVEFQSTHRLYDWNWCVMARNGLVNVCVDPVLRSLYDRLRGEGGRSLPVLRVGQAFGRARGSQIVVAVRDTGAFVDRRSQRDW